MSKPKQEEEPSVDGSQAIVNSKTVSFLPPATLRWLNKRKPADSTAAKMMSASRAMQLRNVFQSLDFDGGGEIELDELKEAINFVGRPRNGGPPLIDDPDKINRFFESMDVDGNGAVDFNEFLVGMTSGDEDDTKMQKMQQAFLEFANLHKRQTILDDVENDSVSDIQKFQGMKTLFSIQFLKQEEGIKTVEEQIKHAQQMARKEMREMNAGNAKSRSIELSRARNAAMCFMNDAADLRKDPMSVKLAIERSNIADADLVTRRANAAIQHSLSKYPIDSRPPTFTRDLSTKKSESQIKFGALLESQRIKGGLTAKQVLLPPVSMRTQIHKKAIMNSSSS